MTEFDPSKPIVEIALELTRVGHRQTVHLRLKSEMALLTLQGQLANDNQGFVAIELANGETFTLDMSSVWYMYRLPSSYVYLRDTLMLGSPND